MFHPDEMLQTFEPAHRLAYNYGVTTREWRTGVRSLSVSVLWMNAPDQCGNPEGKLMFDNFGAAAQFERELVSEPTKVGLESARAREPRGGCW